MVDSSDCHFLSLTLDISNTVGGGDELWQGGKYFLIVLRCM